MPRNLDLGQLEGIVTVSSREAIEMTRRLLAEEGIFCGISSGCNVAAALKVSRKHPEYRRIVTTVNDSGNRYFSTELFGFTKSVSVPEREHHLDAYSESQLREHRPRLEIVT